MTDFLPLGSVIKNDEVVLMIIGYLPMMDETVYAYSAVQFPVGILEDEIIVLKDISNFEVVQIGYSNDESSNFAEKSCVIFNSLNETQPEEING